MAVKRKLSKKQAKQVRKNNRKSQKFRYQKGGSGSILPDDVDHIFKQYFKYKKCETSPEDLIGGLVDSFNLDNKSLTVSELTSLLERSYKGCYSILNEELLRSVIQKEADSGKATNTSSLEIMQGGPVLQQAAVPVLQPGVPVVQQVQPGVPVLQPGVPVLQAVQQQAALVVPHDQELTRENLSKLQGQGPVKIIVTNQVGREAYWEEAVSEDALSDLQNLIQMLGSNEGALEKKFDSNILLVSGCIVRLSDETTAICIDVNSPDHFNNMVAARITNGVCLKIDQTSHAMKELISAIITADIRDKAGQAEAKGIGQLLANKAIEKGQFFLSKIGSKKDKIQTTIREYVTTTWNRCVDDVANVGYGTDTESRQKSARDLLVCGLQIVATGVAIVGVAGSALGLSTGSSLAYGAGIAGAASGIVSLTNVFFSSVAVPAVVLSLRTALQAGASFEQNAIKFLLDLTVADLTGLTILFGLLAMGHYFDSVTTANFIEQIRNLKGKTNTLIDACLDEAIRIYQQSALPILGDGTHTFSECIVMASNNIRELQNYAADSTYLPHAIIGIIEFGEKLQAHNIEQISPYGRAEGFKQAYDEELKRILDEKKQLFIEAYTMTEADSDFSVEESQALQQRGVATRGLGPSLRQDTLQTAVLDIFSHEPPAFNIDDGILSVNEDRIKVLGEVTLAPGYERAAFAYFTKKCGEDVKAVTSGIQAAMGGESSGGGGGRRRKRQTRNRRRSARKNSRASKKAKRARKSGAKRS